MSFHCSKYGIQGLHSFLQRKLSTFVGFQFKAAVFFTDCKLLIFWAGGRMTHLASSQPDLTLLLNTQIIIP